MTEWPLIKGNPAAVEERSSMHLVDSSKSENANSEICGTRTSFVDPSDLSASHMEEFINIKYKSRTPR